MISVGRNTFPIGSTIYQDKEKTGLTKNFHNLSFFDSRRKPAVEQSKTTWSSEKSFSKFDGLKVPGLIELLQENNRSR